VLTIIKKEFAKFFGDKRLVFTTLLLPGLMIFLMYSVMGDALKSFTSVDDAYVYKVFVSNMPDSVKEDMAALDFDITDTDEKDVDTVKADIMDKNADMLIVFPDDFDALVEKYNASDTLQIPPNIEIYYNATLTESANAYSLMLDYFDDYESKLANRFDINNTDKIYNLASDKDVTGEIFSMMLPMLMLVFMFSGCMGIAPESIAGEKERGTIATLLATPIKRRELAIGKIISLSTLALLSGMSSFIGTMLALPKLMGLDAGGMNTAVYTIVDYALLLLVILSTILIFISLISVVSAFSKTVKEATTSIMPLMIIVMLIGITAMFGDGAPTNAAWYLVPVYNSVQCMIGIFSFSYAPAHIIVTLAANAVVSVVFMYVLTRLFNSEKVMFSI
jgi:sodium transport system permease protein